MKTTQETRLENAEMQFNGLHNDKALDLLRDCIKSILDEQRAEKEKRKNQTAEQ